MDEQLDNSCPICAYQFSTPDKVPKLLPCYHTFCSPCINNIIASTPLNSDSTVKCPICRQGANIPKEGVQGFFDNYFRSAPQQEETCDICSAQDIQKLKHCKECNSLLCDTCIETHHHQNNSKHEKFYDCEEDGDCCSDEESPSDSRFLRESVKKYRSSVKTAFFGNHGTTFKCNNFESIRKIIPDDKNECWILGSNGPFVTKFSRSGKEIYRKYVENVLKDIARNSDGSLVLAFSDGNILVLNGQDLSHVTNTENVPTAIYAYQDGRLLIATRPYRGNSHLNNSELLIIDQTTKKIQPVDVFVELQEVSSITVNEKNGQIALCETSKKCVFLFEQDSKKVKKYKGKENLLKMEQTEDQRLIFSESNFFQPRSVENDQCGYFYVLDAGTNLIHVVDGEANLQAVILAEITGNINCFNIDPYDNLWIGNISGQIRVFRMEVRNFLGEGDRNAPFEIPYESGHSVRLNSLSALGGLGLHRLRMELPGSNTADDYLGFGSPSPSSESSQIQNIQFFRNTF